MSDEKRWLTKEQRCLLEPHGNHFEDIALFIRESSNDELTELYGACRACTTVNCGWSLYYAAQYLLAEIATERGVRNRRADEAAKAALENVSQ